jgi:uncharacterized membrane protein YhaH (DUF805 family)
MSFTDSVRSAFAKYATFSGRASRSEYWWFYLFSVLVSVVSGMLDAVLGAEVLELVAMLVLLLPSVAVAVRRLHDSDLSGWWFLALVLGTVVGVTLLLFRVIIAFGDAFSGTSDTGSTATAALLAGALVFLATVVAGLVLMLRPSSPGPNRFGPRPLEPCDSAAAGAARGGSGGSYLPAP